MRICPKCNTEKSVREFYDGNNPYCKPCTRSYGKQRVRISDNLRDLTPRDIINNFPKEDLDLGLIGFIKKYNQ